MGELKIPDNSLEQWADTYLNGTIKQFDPVQDLRDRHDDNRRDIEEIKNVTQIHDVRISQQDMQIYEIREQVKEALAIIHHPGLISNRVLDKLDQFIAKNKKVLTDKHGGTIEVIDIRDLGTAIQKLREVIRNGIE